MKYFQEVMDTNISDDIISGEIYYGEKFKYMTDRSITIQWYYWCF